MRGKATSGMSRKLPATLVFDHPNIGAIAAYLDRMLAHDDPAGAVADRDDGDATAAGDGEFVPVGATAVAEMTDDEVEALLLSKLTELS